MKAKFAKSVSGVGYYQMQESYSSGTTFRLYITNNEPAFVYAFGSDLKTGKNFTIFPNEPGISPALNYAGNAVAIPDERFYVQMDNTLGKDYLCVLYSKETLDIAKIEAAIERESGSFAEKVAKVLGNDLVGNANFKDEGGAIKFGASSQGKKVMAVIVEIDHVN
jgi:hypothetical protein